MARGACVSCFMMLLVSTRWGQETVTIKPHFPQVGERVRESSEQKNVSKIDVSNMGNVKTKEEVKTKKLVYIDEVLANPDMTKKPTMLKRTYETAELGKDGTTTKLPVEGKTVLIQKKDGKYEFTIEGKLVKGESFDMLNNEFNKDASDATCPRCR